MTVSDEAINWACLCRGCELYDREACRCLKGFIPDRDTDCAQYDIYITFCDNLSDLELLTECIAEVSSAQDLEQIKRLLQ
ncbi:MAG: hypothetical protein IJQ29_05330 [Synergistaceae bacterium]|nr:hypothetical protein [Synergistaceae bacterium]